MSGTWLLVAGGMHSCSGVTYDLISVQGIIVLAATNLPETLDPALTRPGRFDRHVVVTNPDVRGRQEILELYLQDRPLSENVDINILARGTPGFSGAANLVNMAAVKAAVDGNDKICTDQLEFAKDKILLGTERKSLSLSENVMTWTPMIAGYVQQWMSEEALGVCRSMKLDGLTPYYVTHATMLLACAAVAAPCRDCGTRNPG